MTKEYSNEEFGFGSNAYADPVNKKEEEKIIKSPTTPAKIQQAAVTAVAPIAEAASASAPAAIADALPPLPTASAGTPPAIENPAQTADFWSSALKGVGLPVGLGLAAGAAGGLLAKRSGGGGGPAGSIAPTIDEDLRQLRLAQEQAKLDALYEKNYRQQQLHEANLARMQTQQGAAVPAASVVPPANVAPVAVEPKPIDPVQQARLDAIAAEQRRRDEAHAAEQRRKDEAHANRLASNAKQAETKNQTKQGTPTESIETTMQKQSYENTIKKSVDADIKAAKSAKAAPAASVPPTATPVESAAPVAVVEKAPAIAPKTSSTKEISLPKEWPAKGMNWLTSQYGEEGARQFINQYNKGEPFKTHDDMKKVYDQVMTKPSFNTMPKDLRKSRGITVNPEYQQYKIVPNAIVPPSLPSGGGGGGMVVPRGGVGNLPGANEQIHALNPLKL